jgi:hypothetical protein
MPLYMPLYGGSMEIIRMVECIKRSLIRNILHGTTIPQFIKYMRHDMFPEVQLSSAQLSYCYATMCHTHYLRGCNADMDKIAGYLAVFTQQGIIMADQFKTFYILVNNIDIICK